MRVINIFGSPGSGKSTLAAGLFFRMKCMRLSVELVTEFAKDLVWDGINPIGFDQSYILASQNHRIQRLDGNVDFVISDSPVLLSHIYGDQTNPFLKNYIDSLFNQYQSINFLTLLCNSYEKVGRVHSEEESRTIQEKIIHLTESKNIYLIHIPRRDDVLELDRLITTYIL